MQATYDLSFIGFSVHVSSLFLFGVDVQESCQPSNSSVAFALMLRSGKPFLQL